MNEHRTQPNGDALTLQQELCATSFSGALAYLKEGLKVKRNAWENQFIYLVPGSHFKVNRKPLLGIYPEGFPIDYRPHIDLKLPDGTIEVWNPTQSDLLAEDWYIYSLN